MMQAFLCEVFFPSKDTDPVVYSGLQSDIPNHEYPSYWLKRKIVALVFVDKTQDILD